MTSICSMCRRKHDPVHSNYSIIFFSCFFVQTIFVQTIAEQKKNLWISMNQTLFIRFGEIHILQLFYQQQKNTFSIFTVHLIILPLYWIISKLPISCIEIRSKTIKWDFYQQQQQQPTECNKYKRSKDP